MIWYRLGKGGINCVPGLVGWPRYQAVHKLTADNVVDVDFTGQRLAMVA